MALRRKAAIEVGCLTDDDRISDVSQMWRKANQSERREPTLRQQVQAFCPGTNAHPGKTLATRRDHRHDGEQLPHERAGRASPEESHLQIDKLGCQMVLGTTTSTGRFSPDR